MKRQGCMRRTAPLLLTLFLLLQAGACAAPAQTGTDGTPSGGAETAGRPPI